MAPLLPCSLNSLFTAQTAWTFVEMPLDLRHVFAWPEVEAELGSQFRGLCAAHAHEHSQDEDACAAQMLSQVSAWVHEQCGEDHGLPPSPVAADADAANHSEMEFRRLAARTYQLASVEFGVDESWAAAEDPLDGCGEVWRRSPPGARELLASNSVFVLGEYRFIDRDFLVKDVLGCVPNVTLCVPPSDPRDEDADMVRYHRTMSGAARSAGFPATHARLALCPTPLPPSAVSVLVAPFDGADGDTPLTAVLDKIVLHRPTILVHTSEETPGPTLELEVLYQLESATRLVLRTIFHPGQHDELTRMGPGRVVWIPMGYGKGMLPANCSGLAATKASIVERRRRRRRPGDSDTELMWAFAGRLGSHPSRAAMSNEFVTWTPHERHTAGKVFFGENVVAPADMFASYRRADFVPSPRGTALDCFRHTEAVIAGAVPILADPVPFPPATPAHGGPAAAAPIGWLMHNAAGDDGRVWKRLRRRAQTMGSEERDLRMEFNARWYVAKMKFVRERVHDTLVEAARALLAASASAEEGNAQGPGVVEVEVK